MSNTFIAKPFFDHWGVMLHKIPGLKCPSVYMSWIGSDTEKQRKNKFFWKKKKKKKQVCMKCMMPFSEAACQHVSAEVFKLLKFMPNPTC